MGIPYDEIPTYLREAFIAIEDKRFMTHKGVDWKRTAGAVQLFLGFDDSSYGGFDHHTAADQEPDQSNNKTKISA